MNAPFRLLPAIFLVASAALTAQETKPSAGATSAPKSAAADQEVLEAKFKDSLTNATLSGLWSGIKDGALTPAKEDQYEVTSATKLTADTWLLTARMQYGKRDLTIPVPVQVRWAGDTPVICVTDFAIPGGGTYSARVLIYAGTYAGTWTGKDHGGLLHGAITHRKK
ncbi:MAG: hypothetical protein K1X78_25315 [Verrucomicrobiaceae bacterium]|nr:hypothetical protein [Verrucomicrobiaceae bacterium]